MGRNTDNAVKLFHELMDEPNDFEDIVANTLLGINMNLAIIADCMEENKVADELNYISGMLQGISVSVEALTEESC